MGTQISLFPRKRRASDNQFQWRFGNNKTTAESSILYLSKNFITDDLTWVIQGGTGTLDDENYFGFSMFLPHWGNEHLTGVHELKDGLKFLHEHSIPAPPGFIASRWVDADSATLNIISYDPESGIAEGTFEAVFKGRYRLNPKGKLLLKEAKAKRPKTPKVPAASV